MNDSSQIPLTSSLEKSYNPFTTRLSLLRCKQWIKNGFILIPLLLQFKLPTFTQIYHLLIGTFLFCLISSSVYIFNDIIDMKRDQLHPVKKFRPIASGAISKKKALLIGIILSIITSIIAFFFDHTYCVIIGSYLCLNVIYSLKLKNYIFIDILVISIGFVLRLLAGFLLLHISFYQSMYIWFLLFIAFSTLFIGIGKRKSELATLKTDANAHRHSLEQYSIELINQIMTILMTCTIVMYIMFIIECHIIPAYCTIFLLIYGIFRYEYLAKDVAVIGRPEKIIFVDRPLRICILLWIAFYLCICIKYSLLQ